jgi:TetR/AcrR family transcriptional regulator, transcriptional repressor for nem operon
VKRASPPSSTRRAPRKRDPLEALARPHGARRDARRELLDGALKLIRAQGYAATSVDDLCRAAGVTKGAFFHHFPSKEALAVAAAQHWSEVTAEMFAAAAYHQPEDPLDRVLGYIDLRHELMQGDVEGFTCLVGTMVQETFASSNAIRASCNASVSGHADKLVADLEAARRLYGVSTKNWNAESLALHTQAVLQGAFILAKCRSDSTEAAAVAREQVTHLKRYVLLLFGRAP